MVLENYVKLVSGVPKRVHITGWRIVERDITDHTTGLPTKRKALVMDVDLEDGRPVAKEFSTLADKLASALFPDLESGVYSQVMYEITQVGVGYQTRFQVTKLPL